MKRQIPLVWLWLGWVGPALGSVPSPNVPEAVSALAGDPISVTLKPVPETPLDNLEPAVRDQLAAKRAKLEALLPSAGSADLIPAFGDLGQLFLLYDRPETAAVCFENVTRLAPGEPNAWYYLGVIRQNAGAFEEALEAFAEVLRTKPSDPATLLRSGEMLFQLRRLDEAEVAFARVEGDHPDSAAAHFGLGRVANSRRQWQQAVDRFQRTLDLQPDADSVYHPLGLALRRLGRIDEAKEALGRSGPSAPVFDDPLMRGLFELTATSRSFYIEGNRARRRGLLELAESYYRRALELDPTDASTLYNLGTLIGEQGRVAEAENLFRTAVEHKPDHRDARFNLAIGLRARGELDDALREFRAVVRLDPNDAAASMELGATLIAAGHAEGSERLLQAASGEIREPQMGLQLVRYLLQTGHPEAVPMVLEKTERAAVRPEDRVAVRLTQAELALADRRSDQAVEWLKEAVGWQPDNPKPAVRLAMTHCLQGDFADAVEVLEQALEHRPDEPSLVESLTKILATVPDGSRREGARALTLARALFERAPGPQSAAALAMALAAAGDFANAVALQERLIRQVADTAPGVIRRRLTANLDRYRQGRIALPPC